MASSPSGVGGFRELVAWQKAYALGLALYRITSRFPDSERFGLISQLRRGGVSIAGSIAEGYGRGGRADYVRFLKIARGALREVDTQAQFSLDLGFASPSDHQEVRSMIDESQRVLAGLIRSLDPNDTL